MNTTTSEPRTRSGNNDARSTAPVDEQVAESSTIELTEQNATTAAPAVTPGDAPSSTEATEDETEATESRRPPVVVPDRSTTPDGYVRCPTNVDDIEPLLQQTIHTSDCSERQRGGYHKCFGCQHCSIPAFDGDGLPPLENSPSHLSDARLAGLNPILY